MESCSAASYASQICIVSKNVKLWTTLFETISYCVARDIWSTLINNLNEVNFIYISLRVNTFFTPTVNLSLNNYVNPMVILFFRKPNYNLRRKIAIDLPLNNYVKPNIVSYANFVFQKTYNYNIRSKIAIYVLTIM